MLSDLHRQLERKAFAAAQGTAREWEARLRRESPVDTGEMRAQTTVKARATPRGAKVEASVNTPYAHIVAFGQRPHQIRPRREGGVLVFDVGGRTVFARSVNHPGAQPNDWWESARRDLPAMLARNWQAVR